MTTDRLIDSLVHDLTPVTPVPLPSVRAFQWAGRAAIAGALAVTVFGVRDDLMTALAATALRAHLALLIVASLASAAAALVLATPGERIGLSVRIAPVAAAAAWLAWLSAELVAAAAADPLGAWTTSAGWACVLKTLAASAVPAGILAHMVARGEPFFVRSTMALTTLAATALGALVTELTCPIDQPLHLLLWHAAPAVAAPIAVGLTGASVLKFVRGWRGGRAGPRTGASD